VGWLKKIVLGLVVGLALVGAVRADEQPIYERELWNVTRSSGADVLTSSLTLTSKDAQVKAVTYRVWVGIDPTTGTDSILYARYTRTSSVLANTDGRTDASTNAGQAANLALNSGNALAASGGLYVFDLPATKGVSLNFRVGTTTILRWFLVQRVETSQ
jgi:hypothetical protein